MTGIRRGWFGALAALLLAGCASYPATFYDAGDGYGYGDYSYGDRRADFYDDRYVDGGAFWSPAWSVYYSNVLYPPYWRSYDPWYTPGWHYGHGYAPGAGWRVGWSSYRYDPWWGGGWYSPFRYSGFGYRPSYYGFGYGYGYGHGYGWGSGYSSNRSWRELERQYGRRAYDPDRRSGGDRRASDELDRVARRNGTSQYDDATRPGDSGFRGGAGERLGTPSAYDGRRDVSGTRDGPSRFGNPAGAAPPARNDDGSNNAGLGRRANGWVAPAPSDGGYSRRGGLPQDSAPADTGRWQDGQRAPREWSSDGEREGASSRQGYRRIETPSAWGEAGPSRRGYAQDRGSAYDPDGGRVAAPINDAARYPRQESPRYERREAPRYEQQESPRFQRQEMPRYERQESPRYERQAAPRQEYSAPSPRFEQPARFEAPSRGDDRPSRDDSPRFEAPSRDDDGSRSASRQLERIGRDDQQP